MKTNTDNRTEERRNRFNGESIMLTKEEAKKHDALFMHELMATLEDKTLGTGASKHWQKMREHIDWFMKNKNQTREDKIKARLLYEKQQSVN